MARRESVKALVRQNAAIASQVLVIVDRVIGIKNIIFPTKLEIGPDLWDRINELWEETIRLVVFSTTLSS